MEEEIRSIYKRIGKDIKFYREGRLLTQTELGEKTKLNKTYISKIENGKGNPTIETILKILQALNCEILILS